MSRNADDDDLVPASEVEVVGVHGGTRADLKNVAVYQKGVLFGLLLSIGLTIGQFALPAEYRIYVAILSLMVSISNCVFVILLATKVYSVVQGVIMGILALIPCLGLIPLLIINGKATKTLQANGIKVGLLGANVSAI